MAEPVDEVEDPEEAAERYLTWISAGYHSPEGSASLGLNHASQNEMDLMIMERRVCLNRDI